MCFGVPILPLTHILFSVPAFGSDEARYEQIELCPSIYLPVHELQLYYLPAQPLFLRWLLASISEDVLLRAAAGHYVVRRSKYSLERKRTWL